MVDLNGSYDPNAEPTGDFDPIPPNDYEMEIIESSVEDISKQNSYGKCLVLTWKVTRGEFENRLVWQRLNMWGENMKNNEKVVQIAMGQFAAIREATGKTNVANSEELHNIPCTVRVKLRPATEQYSAQNEVGSVKTAGGMPTAGGRAPAANNAAPPATGGGAPWRQAG